LRSQVVGFDVSLPAAAGAYSTKVADGDNVLIQAILPLVTNTAGLQAASVTALNASLQTTSEESDVLKAEMTAQVFPVADQHLIRQLATARHELWNQAMPSLDRVYQDYFGRLIPADATQALNAMERTIASQAKGQRKVSPPAWTTAEASYTAG